jgi:uncharacterized protein (DUF1778 family)
MSEAGEVIYNDGFIDGQEDILDEILNIVDDSDSHTEAFEAIMEFVEQKKKEIESL